MRARGPRNQPSSRLSTTAHLVAVALIVAAAVGSVRFPGAARPLAVLIAVTYLVEHTAFIARGTWDVQRHLPLHLTDVVTIVSVLALWTARPRLVELTYFWALTASLQAVLTPNLTSDTDAIFVFTFFITHGGAIVAAILLVFGAGIVPPAGAVGRAFGATVIAAAAAAVGDLVTGGNYMFLREKPSTASLLDVMGPWPVYIAVAGAFGLALFWLLDLPLRRARASPAE
jgi:hypothetical integral membrane protein (TIGR02206 family)